MLADLIRLLSALLATALVPTCIYCIYTGIPWDQKVRFTALILYGTVICGSQIENLADPMTWRTPLVFVGTFLALLGAAMFLVRQRQAMSDGG